MPLMQYKAMDERGRMATGRIEAANAADLELRLERMGLDLVNFAEAKTRYRAGSGTKVKRRELISFCFQLEQLISSGVPVVDGLVDLRDSVEDKRLQEVIAGMIESIEGGKNLSSAMEEFPQVFDGVFVNLVRAGEFSGQVGPVLTKITETLKWQDEQAAQVKKLLMYPSFVGLVIILVLAFLMTYLVPQLVSFIKNMGQELPFHTQILIAVSDVFVKFWWLIMLSPVVVVMGFLLVYKMSPGFQYVFDDFKLRVWLIGPILKKIILARFANYFALMYASGITVLECVRISEGLVGNKAVEEATRRAGRQIADGSSISAGFESTGLFPPLVLRMLRVGESTGALDTALLNISYFYNRDIDESMERLQAMIGPVMTVVLGGILGWVIFSVLGPIYDLISKIDF
jgi:type IV pilus assembly protein PilC